MRRTAGWAIGVVWVLAVLLSACSSDPCAYGGDLPSCQTNKAVANATIAAVNADQAARERQSMMKSTQDTIALQAQATQGSINSRATAQAVSMAATQGARLAEAQATQQAVNNRATSQAVEAAATQNAISLRATVQAIQVIATQTALEGQVKLDQAQQQANAASTREAIFIGLVIAIVVMSGVGFVWYGRRVLVAVTNFLTLRAATVRIGPNGEEVLFGLPRADGKLDLIDPRQMVGAHMISDGRDQPSDAKTPDELFRWLALLEHAKRNQLVTLADKLGALPGARVDEDEHPLLPERAGQAVKAGYAIVAAHDQPPLIAADPHAVEVLDAEWRKVND